MYDTHRPILKAALFQIEALREAVVFSVGGMALIDLSEDAVIRWLDEQELADPRPDVTSSAPVGIILAAVSSYRNEKLEGLSANLDGLTSRALNPVLSEYATARSGADWMRGAEFCISSGFVRLLGASEQFELDVLKALFEYRPAGKPLGDPSDWRDLPVELEVLREEPKTNECYQRPAIWTWLKKHAENNVERRRIFKQVFGLDLTPGSTKDEIRENNKQKDKWYQERNAIAHGRGGVEITLREYLDLDAFVTKSMIHLTYKCEVEQKLIV